jgi:hypothetical protein
MYSRRRCGRCSAFLVLLIAVGVTPGLAQTADASHGSQQPHDPSVLAPASSTLKGAIADSFRLLLIEHSTRIALSGEDSS